jgi:hypothetical protein
MASSDPFGRQRKVDLDTQSLAIEVTLGDALHRLPATIDQTIFGASGMANGTGLSRFNRLRGLMCHLAVVCLQTMRRRRFNSSSR